MPDTLTVPYPAFVDQGTVLADNHNDNWAAIKAKWDARFGALTAGHILVANGSGVVTGVAMSGDGTISSAGVLSLASNSVGTSEIGTLPAVTVTKSANQSIPDSTPTSLTWETEGIDTNTMHDTGSNTDRLTATTAGFYMVTAQAVFATDNTGRRDIAVLRSSDAVAVAHDGTTAPSVSEVTGLGCAGLVKLTAGQYVRVYVAQTRGSALNVLSAATSTTVGLVQTQAQMTWLGEG